MGKTAFSGPVFGAKAGLGSVAFAAGAISSNASTTAVPTAKWIIPTYEDWYVTEMGVQCSTCSSNAASFILKNQVAGVDATVITITSGTSTSISAVTAATPTAGEYQGFKCAAGSTLRVVSSGNSAMGITQIHLRGFVRWLPSTSYQD